MTQRFVAAGRPEPEARATAEIVAAFYAQQASRLGLNMDEMVERFGLPEVRRGDVMPEAAMGQAARSEPLRNFLANSKVKKVVYHATSASFDTFDTSLGDLGAHFGTVDQANKAAERGRGAQNRADGEGASVMPVYINVENPLRLKDEGSFHGWSIAPQLARKGIISNAEAKRIETEGWREQKKNNAIVRDAIKAAGFDSVVYKNTTEGAGDSYIAFEPTQVKSATGNRGTFDPTSPNLLYQVAPERTSEAFREWFGESKVVDDAGEPLVVFHGTNQDFEAFDLVRGGAATGANAGATKAFFFTDSVDVADQYARNAGEKTVAGVAAFEKERARLQKEVARLEKAAQRSGDWDAYEKAMSDWEELETNALQADDATGVRNLDVYLAIRNPMEVDFEGGRLSVGRDIEDLIEEAKAAGHDGLILRNLEDSPKMGAVSTHYAAFEPTQIKAVNNRGTFDPSDPRILFQENRGAIQLGDTNIISLFKTADASTALHETGHMFLSMLKGMGEKGDAPDAIKADWESTKDWWRTNADGVAADANASGRAKGVTAKNVIDALDLGTTGDAAKDRAIDVGMQEQWARGFEAYVREGKAPSAGLARAFEQFKQWLTSIYRRAADLNVNLSDDIRQVFDNLLAEPAPRPTPSIDGKPIRIRDMPMDEDAPTRAEPATAQQSLLPNEPGNAAARVGRDDTMRDIALAHGVDPNTGAFVEAGDIAQLREEGRLTPDDEADLAAADQMYADAEAWGRALDAAVSCVV